MQKNSASLSTGAILKPIVIILAIYLLWQIWRIAAFAFIAFLIASALRPVTTALEKKRIPHILSVIIVLLGLIAIITFIVYLVIPPLVNQVESLAANIPSYWQKTTTFVEHLQTIQMPTQIKDSVNKGIQNIGNVLTSSLTNAIGFIGKIFSSIVNVLFLISLVLYFLFDKDMIQRGAHFIFDNKRYQAISLNIAYTIEKIGGKWIQGYFFISICVGLLEFIGLSIIGVKYAVVLACIGALLEIIPLFGPLISGAIGVLVALFSSWHLALLALVVYLVVEGINNYLTMPLIMKKNISLDPLILIVSISVFEKIAGPIGMLLSIPLTTIGIELWREKPWKLTSEMMLETIKK